MIYFWNITKNKYGICSLIYQTTSEKEKAESTELFTGLIRSIERCQSELLEMMEQKQKAAEKQAEELIKELEQEITEIKRRDTKLEQLSHTEDHLHFLQVSVLLSANSTAQHSPCWGISALSCCRFTHHWSEIHTPAAALRSVLVTLRWVWRLWGKLWFSCRTL